MENRYSKINIRALLDPGGPASIGEENLSALLAAKFIAVCSFYICDCL